MSITKLAPELLRQILEDLDFDELNDAALVCRSWLPPSRDINWNRITLNLDEEDQQTKLAALIREFGEKTTIPRHIDGIAIYGEEPGWPVHDEGSVAWGDDLLVLFGHFHSVSDLTIRSLDLTNSSGSAEKVLLPLQGMAVKRLEIQFLKVNRAADVLKFILQYHSLEHLELGTCKILGKEDDNNVAVQERISLMRDSSSLSNLRHLVIFGSCEALLPPLMEVPSLKNLKTLVASHGDKEIISRLVDTASPSLRSLALDLENEEPTFDLSNVRSLRNLSIQLAGYPKKAPFLLANLVDTVSSLPRLDRLFINCSPDTVSTENEPDTAVELWEKLDSLLTQQKPHLPGLEYVAFTMVLNPCIAAFIGAPGELGEMVESWKGDVVEFAEKKLPACRKRGLLRVEQLEGCWASRAFADEPLGEK